MAARRRRAADRAGRYPMRSPGRPPVARRDHKQRFWAAIAAGCRARRPALLPVCRRRSVSPGSARVAAWIQNGPALAGHGAEAVRDAIASAMTTLPQQLRRSLTWDQGAEMAQHAQLRVEARLAVYFCGRTAPGSAAPTRTPMACRSSPFPRAPT
jgi:hypothetical protein